MGTEAIQAKTRELGEAIAQGNHRLIYGGASIGLMGILADATLNAGGAVVGVMPQSLVNKEVAHHGLTTLHVVSSMHERKAKMFELADAFVVMPGGFGTLEEAFEILTGLQIDLHAKPITFLDVDEFWLPLEKFLQQAVRVGVLRPSVMGLWVRTTEIGKALSGV
jgi:uncharacterized protein (TIGR00730 family)